MFPILLRIGVFEIHTYGLFVALAFLVSSTLFIKKAEQQNLSKKMLDNLVFGILISAIIGARIFYVLINLPYYLSHINEIIKIWQGGLVYWGGFIGGFLYSLYFCKKHKLSILNTADTASPYLALAHAIGRLGCFSAGCCYGKDTHAWCGVVFEHPETLAPIGHKIHPTQLYELFGNFIVFIILLKILNRKKFSGEVFGYYLILYPIVRFIVEFFRGDERGYFFGLTSTQAISTLAFVFGILILWVNKNNANKN